MKTSLHILLAALAATAALAGCVQEITPPSFENDKVNPAAEGSRVIAVSFASQTKTTLDGFQPKFANKDSILISNGEALDTCEVKVDGKGATITTNLTGPLTAVYPYTAAGMSEDNENEIDTVLVSTEQSGKFADANICMAKMTSENDESLSFENKTAVFCIKPPTNSPEYVEVKAEGFNIANYIPTGSSISDSSTIHVAPITTDSVYVSILIPEGLTVGHLSFSDGTNVKTIKEERASTAIVAGTLYTVTNENWKSPEADIPEPLEGVFTVGKGVDEIAGTADDIKVRFSQGNLRYIVGTKEWGFYEHQYDFCNATTFEGHHSDTVSLFTCGYDAEKSVIPDGTGYVEGHAIDGESFNPSEDWGFVFEGESSIWRTLTRDEWCYLFAYNPEENNFITTSPRYPLFKTGVTVCGSENCVVLLPDNWDGTVISLTDFATLNTCNESSNPKWSEMEAAGAVCLPAAGIRNGSNVSNVGGRGYCWSSTARDSTYAYGVGFYSGFVYPGNSGGRNCGYSVRLVTNVSAAPTPTEPDYVVMKANVEGTKTLKWATKNLGATTVAGSGETCFGHYYAWGETAPYYATRTWDSTNGKWTFDTWNTYKDNGYGWKSYCEKTEDSFTEWNPTPYDATNKILKDEKDVAKVKLGDGWRMPKKEDFVALYNACGGTGASGPPTALSSATPGQGIYWLAKDQSYIPYYTGVAGLLFVDDAGNMLFFPAAGLGHDTSLRLAGSYGYYWSSTLCSGDTDTAYCLNFGSSEVYPQSYDSRYGGGSIRPVSD